MGGTPATGGSPSGMGGQLTGTGGASGGGGASGEVGGTNSIDDTTKDLCGTGAPGSDCVLDEECPGPASYAPCCRNGYCGYEVLGQCATEEDIGEASWGGLADDEGVVSASCSACLASNCASQQAQCQLDEVCAEFSECVETCRGNCECGGCLFGAGASGYEAVTDCANNNCPDCTHLRRLPAGSP